MKMKYLIIIVDDEAAILDYYESAIPDEYEVQKFTNPKDAISFAISNSNRLILVISDFKMPQENGFEFREELLSKGIDCPFALVTAFYDKEMATEGMRLKIGRFLEKPILDEQILSLIDTDAKERIESIEEDREMISEFLQETRPMLEEIEELILSLEENPDDSKSINTYFRLLHTIKGTSSCLGLTVISDYAHKYEDLINKIKSNEIDVNRQVINVLLEGLDQLNNLYQLAEKFEPFPDNIDVLAEVFSQDFSDENKKKSNEDSLNQEVASVENKKVVKEKDEKITVSESLLSDFLEMSGELTVIRNTIFKTLIRLQSKYNGDRDLEHLNDSMIELQKVSTILQNQISEMKKVEMESVYRPMRRVVRDSCSVLNKNIDFEVAGGSFKVDTSVAKLLNGVLVHMLRNGVDHGIEDDDTRAKNGKESIGKLSLNSYETGENIIVEVIDNGKGLDKEFLKRKALEKGLYSQEQLDKMSDQKIFAIIFESGFSTNTEVTSVSGRGVGMDMVKSSIQEFGGKILIDSTLGEGTKFVLVIPIPRSILIIKSLMVSSGNSYFNIPLDDVDEVILLDRQKDGDQIHYMNGVNVLRHHGVLCPLVHLGHSLDISSSMEISEYQNIVIVKGDGYRYGLLVDAIDDIEEIVVKKLSDHFKTPEYLGTTFSDDGALSLILDCKGIAHRHSINNHVEDNENEHLISSVECESSINEFMRFSLKEYKNCAIALDYVYRLEEVHSSSIQFTGNRALIRYLNKSLPLIFIENELGSKNLSIQERVSHCNEVMNVLVVRVEESLYGVIIEDLGDIASTQDTIDHTTSDRDEILGSVTINEQIISVLNIESLVGVNKGHLRFNNFENELDKEAA